MHNRPLLYIGAYLPRLSETFVYREVLAFKKNGYPVYTASLHQPDAFDDTNQPLKELAENTVVLYAGWPKLFKDAAAEGIAHPFRTIRTLLLSAKDAVLEQDLTLKNRLVLPGQALAALALARRVRTLNLAHIHSHMAHAPTTIAMYTACQLGIPFSFTGHAADLFRDRALLKCKLHRAAFTACISEWHRAFYQSIAAQPEATYPLVRCGVDLTEFAPEADNSENTPPVLLAAGRLVPKKGFDVLLHALKKIQADGHAVQCQLVGDGTEMTKLKTLCAALKLEKAVQFLGAQPNHEINRLMKKADLFVLPCRVAESGDRDGIPVVLMEAMASEVCVVSGDLPTIRELVKDRQTGFLVQPGDADALASRLEELLKDTILRETISKEGRRWTAEEFSLQKNVQRLETAIEKHHNGLRYE